MSEDRLEEIKGRYDWNNQNGDFFYEAVICGEKIQLIKDMGWLITELEACRAETENAKDASSAKGACMKAALNQLSIARAEIDFLSTAIGGVGTKFEYQPRHRKWALKEMKDKQRLWRNYCGEVSEQMDKVEDCRAEIKCLKAILANKGINF